MKQYMYPSQLDKEWNVSSFLDLVEQAVPLKRVASTNGGEFSGPCPGCGGEDRFHVWPETGRYWCRGCGRKGDTIQFLRDFQGLSFRDACRVIGREILPTGSPAYLKRKRHMHALAAAKEAFERWCHKKFIEYTDRHRELLADQETCAIALRLIRKRPDFLTDEEQDYWENRMGEVCNELASLEWQCDLFTFDKYERERLEMWKGDTNKAPRLKEPRGL